MTRRDFLERVHDPLHHVGDVDDAGQLAADRLDPAAQLGALASSQRLMPFSSQLRTGSNRIKITNAATSALSEYRPCWPVPIQYSKKP